MKKLTIPALLLTAAMLVACDSGTTVVPGKTTDPTTDSPSIVTPTTDASESITAETTTPIITTASITYPTLYEKPDISGIHENVVPIPTIEKIIIETESFGSIYGGLSFDELLEKLDNEIYLIALVTPLEINGHSIHIAIDHVYEEHIPYDVISKEYYSEKLHDSTLYTWCSSCVSQDNSELSLISYFNEIPISTTGGKYVMILDLVIWNIDGTEYCREEYYLHAIPLTWELDMDSVPGSTGDDWNRPPFIGYAENYYAFGFGDVWEHYTAK